MLQEGYQRLAVSMNRLWVRVMTMRLRFLKDCLREEMIAVI